MKKIVLGSLAYTLFTFMLAILWHIVFFEDQYLAFGYFKKEPSFSIGLLSICIQGVILSTLFNYVRFSGSSLSRSMKYVLYMGIFFWTSHVLAFVAKQTVPNTVNFMLMESFYLALQFGIYGFMLSIIHKSNS